MRALDARTLVSYLLRRELVDRQTIVDGDLTIADASRRNRNFGVIRRRGRSYLIKQGIDEERHGAVANEARVYEHLHASSRRNVFRRYLPAYYGYDDDERILILQFLRGSRNLREHTVRSGRFSKAIASALGDALGRLHLQDRCAVVKDGRFRSQRVPWVLSLHRPGLPVFCGLSDSNLDVIRIVQRYPAFREHLDRLHREWTESALIHGDIKWENILVLDSDRTSQVKLVDWELASVGDPDWDVGSVFSAYLGFWQFFVPVAADADTATYLQFARYPLEKMQPALRAFWESYVRVTAFDAVHADERLLRSVRYAGARLAQTAYELMQTSSELAGSVVSALQLSLNILERPEEATRALLGIPSGRRR